VQQQPLISVRDVMSRVAAFLPSLVAGIVVLAIGLLAWWLVAKFVARLLVVLRLDRVLSRIGWGKALAKGDVRHALFQLVGTVLGAIVFLIFLDNAFVIWNLTVLSRLLESLVLLIPDLVVAAVIVTVGWVSGALAARSASRGLSRAGVLRAALAGQMIRTAVSVLAVAIALIQLDVAATIVSSAFLITFGALGLSFVLAVGLGSRRAVELMWEEVLTRRRESAGRPRPPAARPGQSADG
jgi:hypothetical protein